MGKIQVLDTNLTNMIAAGEVVERIASVVKELTENAIDAGATKVKISLTDAGLSEIRVVDNGSGMDASDARMSVLPHATSKIRSREDLFSIRTLGFRGEALASIASVSNFKIITSTDGYHGFMISWRGGSLLTEGTIGHPKGSEIIVKNLFFNTPVRLQSLQSKNIELGYVIDYVSKMALARPNIAFELYNDNKVLINTFGSNDVMETIYAVYGTKVAKNMVSIFEDNGLYKIEGFISNISETRSTKNNIVLAINGRIIRNYSIVSAIIAGYGNKLMNGRYPICLINIKMDASMVDVNVHPSKLEVRFAEEEKLKALITHAVSKVLDQTDLAVRVEQSPSSNSFFSKYNEPVQEETENPNSIANQLDNVELLEIKKAEEQEKFEKQMAEINKRNSPFEENKLDDEEELESKDELEEDKLEDEEELDSEDEIEEDKLDDDEELESEEELEEDKLDTVEELDSDEELEEDKLEGNEELDSEEELEEIKEEDIPFSYDELFNEDMQGITNLLEQIDSNNGVDQYGEYYNTNILHENKPEYNAFVPDENSQESVEFDAKEAEIGLSEKINSEKPKYVQMTLEEALQMSQNEEDVDDNEEENKDEELKTAEKLPELHYIGQLFGTYILANDEDTFYLIDQHAAMERINYEKIKKELEESETLTYDLLVPFNIEFGPRECYMIQENMAKINKLGIQLEEFGNNSFVVRSIPTWIFRGKEKEFVEEIVTKIINATQDKEYNKAYFLDSLAKSLACKKSIKGNEYHSQFEIEYLMEALSNTLNPYTCPHGRPVIIRLSKDEIEKWFKRIV